MPIALHNAVDDDESSEASYRRITPAEFAKLDPNTVTLLDLREPADFAAHPGLGMAIAPMPHMGCHQCTTRPSGPCAQNRAHRSNCRSLLCSRMVERGSS